MKNDWEIQIMHLQGRIDLGLFIFRRLHDGKIEVMTSKDTRTIVNEREAIEPVITLKHGMLRPLMKELSEHNVKMPEQSFIEGKLYATEAHLQDMRKLVFQEHEMTIVNNPTVNEFAKHDKN